LLSSGAGLTALIGGSYATWWMNGNHLRTRFPGDTTESLDVVSFPLSFPGLPDALIGMKIAFLTDVHAGIWLSDLLLDSALNAISQFAPDLLLLGGDYVYLPERDFTHFTPPIRKKDFYGLSVRSSLYSIMEYLHSRLSSLVSSIPLGAVAVLGNHDKWHHPQSVAWSFRGARANLLINEMTSLVFRNTSFSVTGVDDYLTGVPRLPNTSNSKGLFSILVSHNPDFPAHLAKRGSLTYDLVLCGHTHGGQIRLPIVGAPIYNVEHREVAEGLHLLGSSYVYTSRGLGVVELPYRVCCTPEVTLITLQKEKAN
jgi:uncharacterized protein